MKVWLVGIGDVESSEIKHVCKTEKLAIKKLFEERDKLFKKWDKLIESCKKDRNWGGVEIYSNMISRLSDNNYKNWDNYPYKTPFIEGMEVEEEEESKLKPPEPDKDKTKRIR